jgi:radical SAM superfamily enzyme YgiQ (UPF0313 family)
MNIQLFAPPSFYYGDMQFKMLPTLGLPILASILNKAGHYTEVVDLEALGVSPPRFRDGFNSQVDNWPDVIGFTGLNVGAVGIRDCITVLRMVGFKGMIMVGGSFATHAPDTVMSWGADMVVTGECEGNIVELVESGARGIQAGKAAPIADIPMPDWDHFRPNITDYHGNMAMLRPNPGVTMWARGCPYQCIFCSNNIFNHHPTRYRPPENIEAEMLDLKKRGAKRIYVYDDELVGTKMPPGWMKEIADRIGPMGFWMVTQGRCSRKYINRELMDDVRRAGIQAVFWGVESFSQKVLDAMKKHLQVEDIWHTLRLAKEAGIENGIFVMIGNYLETDEDVKMTADALEKAYKEGLIDYRQSTICTVMEGTEFENIQKREGWFVERDFAGRDLRKTVSTPWLSANRMEYWQAYMNNVCPVGIPQ